MTMPKPNLGKKDKERSIIQSVNQKVAMKPFAFLRGL